MRPLKKINTKWSVELAYVIGLIVSDGNLSKTGRHVIFVSKDMEQINTIQHCLKINNKVSLKKSGYSERKQYYYIQIGDVSFYRFLLSIGLTPAKSKTMDTVKIPSKYFADFLRGNLDGDGTFYSYWDKRWASSFLFYVIFTSASLQYITWLRTKIEKLFGILGHITGRPPKSIYQLKYAKQEAEIIIKKMYHKPDVPKLERKFIKISHAMAVNLDHNTIKARVL